MAAEMIVRPSGGERDMFWDNNAETMLTAGIAYQLSHDRHDCSISKMFDLYSAPDNLTETLSEHLSTTKNLNRTTRAGWSGFCALPESNTRPCVLGSTISRLRLYDNDLIRRLTDTTTIDLEALVAGEPMSIYIIVPPHRIKAYAPILRLWLTMLMGLFTTRRAPPKIPTLLMIDEAAQLGRMDAFESATTLMRGCGLKIWTFWQSISQLDIYGAAAKTLVDNAGVVQVLGVNNRRAAQEIADIVGGITADELVEMSNARPPRQLLAVSGRRPRICGQLRYFDDPMFQG